MTAGHYVAVEVRDGISEPMLFTSELPAPLAPYAMALIELANNSERLITLVHEVGRLTTLLGERDEQIHELQAQLVYYEAASSAPTPAPTPAHAPADAVTLVNDEPETSAPELPEEPAVQPTPEQALDAVPQIDLTPDPSLSERDQQLERATLYGLHMPGLALRRPDTGGFVRRELGIEDNQEWQWLRKKMGDLGIYSFEKESPGSRRTKGICVSVEAVLVAAGKSFVTPRVLGVVASLQAEGAFVASDAGKTAVPPVSSTSNGNGAGPGHVISARVRRAMALDAARPLGSTDVYRTNGKKPPEIKPFFEHQPVSTGAKRH